MSDFQSKTKTVDRPHIPHSDRLARIAATIVRATDIDEYGDYKDASHIVHALRSRYTREMPKEQRPEFIKDNAYCWRNTFEQRMLETLIGKYYWNNKDEMPHSDHQRLKDMIYDAKRYLFRAANRDAMVLTEMMRRGYEGDDVAQSGVQRIIKECQNLERYLNGGRPTHAETVSFYRAEAPALGDLLGAEHSPELAAELTKTWKKPKPENKVVFLHSGDHSFDPE